MSTLDVWEGESFEMVDSRDLDWLGRRLRGSLRRRPDGWEVVQRVGWMRLPSGSDFRIRSRKANPRAILAWLAYADPSLRDLEISARGPVNAADGELDGFIAAAFAATVLDAVARHGLGRGYERTAVEGSTVRGRIDFARLSRQGGNLARLPCTTWLRLPSTPVNAFLAAALQRVRRVPALSGAIPAELPRLTVVLDGVRPSVAQHILDGSRPLPRNELAFAPAVALARLILTRTGLGDGSDRVGASFLIDIAALFERTVAAGFREAGFDSSAQHVIPYTAHEAATADASSPGRFYADVLVRGADGRKTVVDAKYKHRVSSANLHQVVAYAALVGANSAALVVPADSQDVGRVFRFDLPGRSDAHGGSRLAVRVVGLRTDGTSTSDWRAAARDVAREAAGLGAGGRVAHEGAPDEVVRLAGSWRSPHPRRDSL